MNKLDKEESVMNEEIICPNCGSSDCEEVYLTANNAKKVGKTLLGWGFGGPLGGMVVGAKDFFDSDKNQEEFECNNCGYSFTYEESMDAQGLMPQSNSQVDSYDGEEYKTVSEMCNDILDTYRSLSRLKNL